MKKIYNIYDITQYRSTFDKTQYSCVIKEYLLIIDVYLQHIKSIYHDQSIDNPTFTYSKHILPGLYTVTHCFRLLYLYTKNLKLTSEHCILGSSYYIEFLRQMGEPGKKYLKLTSKDATQFVYKKTIYTINHDYTKQHVIHEDDLVFINAINSHINIFVDYFVNLITLINKTIPISPSQINHVFNIATPSMLKLIPIPGPDYTESTYTNYKVISYFIRNIIHISDQHTVASYSCLVETFLKKHLKYDISIFHLSNQLYNIQTDQQLDTLSTVRFINWIFRT
jgi:hypothetical protein